MKSILFLLSSAMLLFAFGDRAQNSFSQQAPKLSESKAKVNYDSIRLARVSDSLRIELEKTKVIVAETQTITEESKQLTQDLLINKEKHTQVKNLATQTLRVAVYKSDRLPMNFNVHPIKEEKPVPVIVVTPPKDTVILKKKKKFRWPWR